MWIGDRKSSGQLKDAKSVFVREILPLSLAKGLLNLLAFGNQPHTKFAASRLDKNAYTNRPAFAIRSKWLLVPSQQKNQQQSAVESVAI